MNDPAIQLLADLAGCGVRRGELPRDGRVVRWAEAGSGRPVVVLDAALGEPGMLAWASVMPLVAPVARVVAYDRAGIGASDPMSPLTLDGQFDDLAAVLEATGDGPCVVAGHSWGGLLAQLVTMRRPELVAGLVLVDPAEERYLAALPYDDLRQGSRWARQSSNSTLRGSWQQPSGQYSAISPGGCPSMIRRRRRGYSIPTSRATRDSRRRAWSSTRTSS